MKRSFLIALLLAAAGTARAQIIQSSALTVETTEYEKTSLEGGYKGLFEAGLAVDCMDGNFNYEFTTAHGYRFASGLFLGLGTGISTFLINWDYYAESKRLASLPLFADVRWYFGSRSSIRFFAGTRLGYAIALNKREDEYAGNNSWTPEQTDVYAHYESVKLSGLYFSIGFGFEFKRVSLSLNYLLQSTLQDYVDSHNYYQNGIYDPGSSYSRGDKYRDYDTSSVMLRIGISF